MAAAVFPPAANRPNRVAVNFPFNDNTKAGRYLIWYGWQDMINPIQPNTLPAYVGHMETFQCSAILPNTNGVRCTKTVVLGSDCCHLHLRGIRADKAYKWHSNVIDHIISVRARQAFNIGDVVMTLHAEILTTAEHINRYQDPNRVGPHEFGYINANNPNQRYYVDCTLFCSEGDFITIDDNNGNVYLDMNQQHFHFAAAANHQGFINHQQIRPINIIARRQIQPNDIITLKETNTPSSHNFHRLVRATHNNAYYEKKF